MKVEFGTDEVDVLSLSLKSRYNFTMSIAEVRKSLLLEDRLSWLKVSDHNV